MKRFAKMSPLIGVLFFIWSFATVFAANLQYTYDDLNRLIKVDYGDGRIIQYSYDEVGNRLTSAVIVLLPVIGNFSYPKCLSELCTAAISVDANDPCGGSLTYTWTPLNGGSIVGTGAAVTFRPPTSGPHPCPYQISIKVTSGASGLSTTQQISVYVKLAGDVDGNGVVNVLDKVLVRNHFAENPPVDARADVNCDGVVNVLDKVLVRNPFGETGCSCPVN